jgi:hypothetical protein
MKDKTMTALLDISRAYDNVLIDVLCKNLCGLQVPLEMVRILWNHLHLKNGRSPTRLCSKSTFIQIDGAGIYSRSRLTRGMSILQYADNIVILEEYSTESSSLRW